MITPSTSQHADLWSPRCAVQTARILCACALAIIVAGVAVKNAQNVWHALGWLLNAGGFWHTFAITASLAVVSFYFGCVATHHRDSANSLAALLAVLCCLLSLLGILIVAFALRGDIWIPTGCESGSGLWSREVCTYDVQTWRLMAILGSGIAMMWQASALLLLPAPDAAQVPEAA